MHSILPLHFFKCLICYTGEYLGDKGFILKPEEQQLLEDKGVMLLTAKRKNMKAKTPEYVKYLLKRFRSMVETVNGHLTELFSYNKPGGKSERGVFARLNYKLAAHTTGQTILHRRGLPTTKLDWLTGVCLVLYNGRQNSVLSNVRSLSTG